MTAPSRLMSPQLSFQSAMKGATATDSPRGTTVTADEAKAAVAQLEGHPHADAAERARIVTSFLGSESGLSTEAAQVLRDFVRTQQSAPGGLRADELKQAAAKDAKSAETDLKAARSRIDELIRSGAGSRANVGDAISALDKAAGAVDAALGSLSGALRIADHSADMASRQLKDAGNDIAAAKADLQKMQMSKGGPNSAALERVLGWLNEPLPELAQAQATLQAQSSQPDVQTRKFPSDNEDNAGGGDTGGVGGQVTLKFPSDNEDTGGDTGGGVITTMKAPSDNEDNAGGPLPGGDGVVTTMKAPSDNEDNAGGGGVISTMKAPSDNEDNAGGPAPPDGPGGTPTTTSTIKRARLEAMWSTFETMQQQGQVQWANSMPLGPRYAEGFLFAENHVDGFGYDALVAVGNLAPNAAQSDPNSVNNFWVRRSGGIAGMIQYAGPFSLS